MPVIDKLTKSSIRATELAAADEKRPSRFLDYGWPLLNEALLGLDHGVVLIASPPNQGKSALLLNTYSQVIEHNPDVFVLDFSLDDSFEDRVRNAIARMAKIPINWVKLPSGIPDEAKQARRDAYAKWHTTFAHQLQIIDETELEGKARNFSSIKACVEEYRAKLPPFIKLFVAIDGFHNIVADGFRGDDNQIQKYLSAEIKNMAERNRCVVFATTHTPKGSMKRGLDQDAVLGAGRATYDAKAIGTIFSDYKVNRGNAEIFHDMVLPHSPGITTRLPVIELDITKNKAGSFSDVIFFKFVPEYAYVEEADDKWQVSWKKQLYSGGS